MYEHEWEERRLQVVVSEEAVFCCREQVVRSMYISPYLRLSTSQEKKQQVKTRVCACVRAQ